MSENKNEPETAEEKGMHDDLLKKIQEIDQKLAMFQQASGEVNPEENVQLGDMTVINKRGQKVVSTEEMRENYENGTPFLRVLNLPYCQSSIIGKAKFWLVGGAVAAFTWEYKKNIENKLTIRDLTFKRFFRSYALISMAGMAFSIFESVMFDPFCDIESYHYTKKFNTKLKIQRLKDESRGL